MNPQQQAFPSYGVDQTSRLGMFSDPAVQQFAPIAGTSNNTPPVGMNVSPSTSFLSPANFAPAVPNTKIPQQSGQVYQAGKGSKGQFGSNNSMVNAAPEGISVGAPAQSYMGDNQNMAGDGGRTYPSAGQSNVGGGQYNNSTRQYNTAGGMGGKGGYRAPTNYDYSAARQDGPMLSNQATDPNSLRHRLQQYGKANGMVEQLINDIQVLSRRSHRGDVQDTLKSDENLCDVADAWELMVEVKAGRKDSCSYSPELLTSLGVTAQQLQGDNPLGLTPDQRMKKHLQVNSKKAYYEYCTLFKEENLMEYRQEQDLPRVLVVAEKPSVAKAIAEFLSNGRMRTKRGIAKMCPVHEFFNRLGNQKVQVRVTSVVGHLFGLDFADNRRRDEVDPNPYVATIHQGLTYDGGWYNHSRPPHKLGGLTGTQEQDVPRVRASVCVWVIYETPQQPPHPDTCYTVSKTTNPWHTWHVLEYNGACTISCGNRH